MASLFKKKWFWVFLACASSVASIFFFVQWSEKSHLVDFQLKEHKLKYIALQDSIQHLNYSLRDEPPVHIATLQKDRIQLFQSQALQLREKISHLSERNDRKLTHSLTSSGQLTTLIKQPWAQVSLYSIIGVSLGASLIVMLLLVIRKRRLRSKRKSNRMPPADNLFQSSQSPSPLSPTSDPHAKSSDLEQLLSQLQTQAPIGTAKTKGRVVKPSARSQVTDPVAPTSTATDSPLEMVSQDQKSLPIRESLKESMRESVRESIHESPPPKSALTPSEGQSNQLADRESSTLFPSSMNRFDRLDKEKLDVLKLARRGYTSSEIARRLKLSQDQVDFIIKLQREKG